MMKYDELLEILRECNDCICEEHCPYYEERNNPLRCMTKIVGDAADAIDELQKQIPSADAAEVVRCKDCKNNYVTTHNHGKQDDPRCDFTDRHLSLADFCSRGERRMDGGT